MYAPAPFALGGIRDGAKGARAPAYVRCTGVKGSNGTKKHPELHNTALKPLTLLQHDVLPLLWAAVVPCGTPLGLPGELRVGL